MDADIDVDLDGPLFRGQWPGIIDDMLTEMRQSLGQAAMSELHERMDRSFRKPTPYYETQIVMDRQVDSLVVHDHKIIYGPWLEGVGSRNRSTRFKGYRIWRGTKQEIAGRSAEICERVFRRMRGRLG
jgi:hypothetical protein